jgi:hypothetical protein
MFSLMGLSIDTERSPLWAVMLMVAWFAGSSLLLKVADKRGWMNEIVKRYKLDEL